MAACTVAACWASITGCRGWIGTTAVPSSTPGTRAPTTAKSVSVSWANVWLPHALAKPASASLWTLAVTSSIDREELIKAPMRTEPSGAATPGKPRRRSTGRTSCPGPTKSGYRWAAPVTCSYVREGGW
jgi:hypothetical protein